MVGGKWPKHRVQLLGRLALSFWAVPGRIGPELKLIHFAVAPAVLWTLSSPFLQGTPLQDRVVRVVDGDTVILERLGRARLIGVDAPESVHPEYPAEHFGKESARFTKTSLEGRDVTLEFGDERTDSFNRKLVYVYLPDGTLFNAQLVKLGYAFAYTQFPFRLKLEFLRLEDAARHAGAGMWSTSVWRSPGTVFHGNQVSRVYHSPQCEHYNCPNCILELESRVKAESEGFRPHAKCVLSVH